MAFFPLVIEKQLYQAAAAEVEALEARKLR